MNLRIDVYHHVGGDVPHAEILSLLAEIMAQLGDVQSQGESIMATVQELTDAIAKIDAATTKQGQALQIIADDEQKTSDTLDALIVKLGTSVPPEVVAQVQALADRAQTVSDHLDAQAAFSTALAAKGAATPVPTPPPPAPPLPVIPPV